MGRDIRAAGIESLESRQLLAFNATGVADVIRIENSEKPDNISIQINDVITITPLEVGETVFTLNCLGGNDRVTIARNFKFKIVVYGGTGNDRLVGGDSSDTLAGN